MEINIMRVAKLVINYLSVPPGDLLTYTSGEFPPTGPSISPLENP